ncbi:MAG: hypothetical protein LBL64_03670 [Treponema sp.]|jgi:hypothetical protein|nr:hypothetical protein [Treponema sp.]
MKKVFLVGLVVIILGFAGCQLPTDSEPTYTVWTDVWTYAQFRSELGTTLGDGYYTRFPLTNSEFSGMYLSDQAKHDWTEGQLYDWFIGRGFGETEANQEKAWFITATHGFLASRTGNIVDVLVK